MSTAFPLVSIGGSAGGLEAFCKVLDNLPVNTGCAFVILNHARSGLSLLPEILRRHTRMPVIEIRDGMQIECDQVFVIPPACDLRVRDGKFVLEPLSKVYGWPNVITLFLSSVVANWNGLCVAILVSGLHSDGVAALRGVRAAGGLSIVQDPTTASVSEIPENAIKSGFVDFVLSAGEIGRELSRIVGIRHTSLLRVDYNSSISADCET